jgi:hypothetical protein
MESSHFSPGRCCRRSWRVQIIKQAMLHELREVEGALELGTAIC